MKPLEYSVIYAFGDQVGKGNPAGVIWNADDLSRDEMQKIAKLNGLSETAFLHLQDRQVNPYSIEFFTPANKVSMCGHASLAAAYIYWKHRGMPDQLSYVQTTDAGNLMVKIIAARGHFTPQIRIQMDRPKFVDSNELDRKEVMDALGVTEGQLNDQYPLAINDKGYVFVALKDARILENIEPNTSKVSALDRKIGGHGWLLFAESGKEDCDYQVRFFAPTMGVNEDPVTGTANGYLLLYLRQIMQRDITSLNNLQGGPEEELGKISVFLESPGAHDEMLWVGGSATEYFEGKIRWVRT